MWRVASVMRGICRWCVTLSSPLPSPGVAAVLRRLSSGPQPPLGVPVSPELQSHSAAVQRVHEAEMASQVERTRARVAELVQEFQRQPGDTGSTPVQVAVLTFRIKHLTEHVKRNTKDFSCQRSLVKMVHQRRKLLRYLQRTDYPAYQSVLAHLQLRAPKPHTYSRTSP